MYRMFFSRPRAMLFGDVLSVFQWKLPGRGVAIGKAQPFVTTYTSCIARTGRLQFHSQSASDRKDSLEPTAQSVGKTQQRPLDSGTLFTVKVPTMGNGITHGKIYQWYKSTGDNVDVGDLLCVIETDQIFGKVHSQISGVVVETVGNEGCKVRVGGDLTIIRKDDVVEEEEEEVVEGDITEEV